MYDQLLDPLKRGIEGQYGNAIDNILSSGVTGGGLASLLSQAGLSRAQSLGDTEKQLRTQDILRQEAMNQNRAVALASRSVCSNLAESWRKRRYKAVFKNKLTDAMQEASETQTWLEFCCACNYIDKATFEKFHSEYERLLAMLNTMDRKAETFCFSTSQPPNFTSS